MAFILLPAWQVALAADKPVIGWLEQALIGEGNIRLEAKVDTGADTTSIKARVLATFLRGDEKWIRFLLQDNHGHSVELERRIIRHVKIKRKMAPPLRRPVVMLGICIGHVYREVEVNLAVRERFKYHMLIGRNFLQGVFLVDAGQENTTRPSCSGVKGD